VFNIFSLCYHARNFINPAMRFVMLSAQAQREKQAIHNQVMQAMQPIIDAYPKGTFEAFIPEFTKGVSDSTHYNRAIRRLCTSSHASATRLLGVILPHRLALQIDVSETNNTGLSAVDYAKTNNPKAHRMLLNAVQTDMMDITSSGVSTMLGMPTPISGGRRDQHDAFSQMFGGAGNFLANLLQTTSQAQVANMTPTQRDAFSRQAAQNLVASIQPQIDTARGIVPQHNIPSAEAGETFEVAFERLSAGDEALQPFFVFCQEQKYSEALHWVAQSTHPKAGQVMDALLQHKTELGIDINTMTNNLSQSPLHVAAITSNWAVYYSMVSHGGNSHLPDYSGKSAGDYKRANFAASVASGGNIMGNLLSNVLGTNAAQGPTPPADDMHSRFTHK
jgi:hypothetical protein